MHCCDDRDECEREREMSDTETQLMRLALKRHNVKPLELYYAVLDAYEDQYTPSSGLEWKHVWKHIKSRREETYQPPMSENNLLT